MTLALWEMPYHTSKHLGHTVFQYFSPQ